MSSRGNALFLILIAVALFAALSYAITQSGRGGGTIDKELDYITAARTAQYGAYLSTATTRMVLTGTPASLLSYGGTSPPCGSGVNCVFDPQGGGATYEKPPSSLGINSWVFAEVGDGAVVDGVGTGAEDVVMFLRELNGTSVNVCRLINKALGLSYSPVNQNSVDTNMGSPMTIDAYPGQPFACYKDGPTGFGGAYHYYHVLVER